MLIKIKNADTYLVLNSDKIVSIEWVNRKSVIEMENGRKYSSTDKPSEIMHECWQEWQGIFNAATHAFPNLASPDGIDINVRGRLASEPYLPQPVNIT